MESDAGVALVIGTLPTMILYEFDDIEIIDPTVLIRIVVETPNTFCILFLLLYAFVLCHIACSVGVLPAAELQRLNNILRNHLTLLAPYCYRHVSELALLNPYASRDTWVET